METEKLNELEEALRQVLEQLGAQDHFILYRAYPGLTDEAEIELLQITELEREREKLVAAERFNQN